MHEGIMANTFMCIWKESLFFILSVKDKIQNHTHNGLNQELVTGYSSVTTSGNWDHNQR